MHLAALHDTLTTCPTKPRAAELTASARLHDPSATAWQVGRVWPLLVDPLRTWRERTAAFARWRPVRPCLPQSIEGHRLPDAIASRARWHFRLLAGFASLKRSTSRLEAEWTRLRELARCQSGSAM